jgi:outer membrane protein
MKNGLLIWNIVLTILVGYLLFTKFATKKGAAVETIKTSARDTSSSHVNSPFRIAYFEMDSVAANFEAVKELRAEMSKREEAITRELDNLGKNIQKKYNGYQTQAQAGTLTQAQSEAAGLELRNLDEGMKNRKQELDQDYNDFVLRRQNDIKSKIEAFLAEYNKTRGYTYIISYEQGLFYYKDTAYNITDDVVKGLNEEFKKKKKE